MVSSIRGRADRQRSLVGTFLMRVGGLLQLVWNNADAPHNP